MSRSSRLSNILKRQENRWNNDSETDTSSILSDNEEKKQGETSSDENSQPTCCLICSILPNLSNLNTCQKHLNLMNTTKTPTPQVVYVVHSPINNCHCQTKSKRRCRSISSSSSESQSQHQRKKRTMTIQLSNNSSQDDVFFSPIVQSQTNRSNPLHARLSPSLPPSSIISTNKHYPEPLLTPFLQQNNIEIVHVKDENESFSDTDQTRTTINMSEATEQMLNHEYPQPIILLKRVSLEELR